MEVIYGQYLTKFSTNGSVLWQRDVSYIGRTATYISDFDVDAEGNIYLTGNYGGKGNSYDGGKTLSQAGNGKFFQVLSPSDSVLSTRIVLNTQAHLPEHIVILKDGTVQFYGNHYHAGKNIIDVWRFDKQGNRTFAASYDPNNPYTLYPGTAEYFGDDNTQSQTNGSDVFMYTNDILVKIDASGQMAYHVQPPVVANYGLTRTSFTADAAGNVFFTGNYNSATIDFDPGPNKLFLPAPTSPSGLNQFVDEYDSNGNFARVEAFVNGGQNTTIMAAGNNYIYISGSASKLGIDPAGTYQVTINNLYLIKYQLCQ